MDMFVIQGGAKLSGRISVSGSKNATLPIMAAALATDGETRLSNVPDLVDVRTLSKLLQSLGMSVERSAPGTLSLQLQHDASSTADYNLVRQMRASVCVLGPLLAKRGHACVSLPGGCNIGHRPIDLHLKGLAALGAKIDVRGGYVHATAKQLRGTSIFLGGLNGSTVTGTCNVMTAATLAKGTTVITAAACEPEVVALADVLNLMGAMITGQGTPRIEIEGVDHLQGTQAEMIPDRVEAATLLIAAAITRGSVTLDKVNASHLTAVLDVLAQAGCRIIQSDQTISLQSSDDLQPVDFTALPYPGVPTDTQAQLMALACTLSGTSIIHDQVFPDRFMHVSELCRMGAQIRQQGATAIVSGIPQLTGTEVMASDLRASAALVIAGLAAQGETTIRSIHHLDRGYERLEAKFCALGANVVRTADAQVSTLKSPASQFSEPQLIAEPHFNLVRTSQTEAADEQKRSA
ncbi:UDP-N-acetylglucosamine 1-carboxyvinyltransferase [Planctomicrobium sp. SH527]|uniref:UDP-N-acetylglucosamine 1-carboxyvinyltransferase n=1 Tax=Planctomicrobium sp. SH527 TaxID=3448123 RepID=UPI003F5C6AAE